MNDILAIFTGIICGALLLVGTYYQYRVFTSCFDRFNMTVNWGPTLATLIYSVSAVAGFVNGHYILSMFMLYVSLHLYFHRDGKKIEYVNIDFDNVNAIRVILIPFLVSLGLLSLSVFGATASYIMGFLDNKIEVVGSELGVVCSSLFILCAAFFFKTLFGVTVLTWTIIWFVWNLLMHGEFSLLPVFAAIVDMVAGTLPIWIGTAYISITLCLSLFTSTLWTFSD